MVSWAFRLAGVSLAVARAVSVGHAMIALAAVGLAARELVRAAGHSARAGWASAVVAALVLALAPNFVWASRAAMKGLPSFSLGTLAMAFAIRHARQGGTSWLAAAAVALGVALWIKVQLAYLGLLLGFSALAVAWRASGGRWRPFVVRAGRDMAILAAGSLGPLALAALAFPVAALLEQGIGTYLATRERYTPDLAENLATMQVWLGADNLGLVALALVGAVLLARRPTAAAALALGWAALAALTPLQHAPLFLEDHFLPLLFALAVLAGTAVGIGAGLVRAAPGRSAGWQLGLVGIGCVAYLAAFGHLVAVDRTLLVARDYDNDGVLPVEAGSALPPEADGDRAILQAAAIVREHTPPGEFVISDDQIIAFHAGRRVPPELASLSSRRVRIGSLSTDQLVEITERYQVPVVLAWEGQLKHFEDYMAWLDENFTLVAALEAGQRLVYVRDPTSSGAEATR
jgi:hypothetical protein